MSLTVKKRPRMYHPELSSSAEGAILTLTKEASFHLIRVLRMRKGDALVLFDGCGQENVAVLVELGLPCCTVSVQPSSPQAAGLILESPLKIHLIQALTGQEKMDFILQKAVELGVDCISLVETQRCVARYSKQLFEKKQAHFRAVMVHACAQSGRSVLPRLHGPETLSQSILADCDRTGSHRYVLDPRATQSIQNLCDLKPDRISILIGPEGGFSEQELHALTQMGVTPLRLGPRTLRMETAGLAALAVFQAYFGDLA